MTKNQRGRGKIKPIKALEYQEFVEGDRREKVLTFKSAWEMVNKINEIINYINKNGKN